MNKSDSERFATKMEELGYKQSRNKYEASFVIINTCGVRQTAESRIYGLIPSIKKKNKKAKIIITGCLVYRKDVRRRLDKEVDYWIPIVDIPELKLSSYNTNKKIKPIDYLSINPKCESDISALVPIGNGCNNFCTYCVVPFARDREVYRPANEIIKEVEYLVQKGYKEIILIAQNVNSYLTPAPPIRRASLSLARRGSEGEVDFADLLKMVNDIPGNFWIRFLTSHPKDMTDKLIKTISECEKVCRNIHLPVQAGDNKILKIMNRGYTVRHYKKLIKKIRQLMPEVSMTTDAIVGFPSETKKQFNNTKKLFKEVGYDMAYISQYSSRPDTAAEKLGDDVSQCEKRKREDEITEILKKTALENNKKYLGKTVEVLIEGKNRKGEWYGKTNTYKNVKIKILEEKVKAGEFYDVKITQAGNFGLEGVVVSKKLLVIIGPTSSGKTKLAVKLAKKYDGEIVSADSRQVYKGMDIGTGKDLKEYGKTPYHLIDVANPKEQFSLAQYQKLAFDAIDDILSRGKLPILVGGSGLYLQAVVDNYELTNFGQDEKLRKKLEKYNIDKLFQEIIKLNPKFADKIKESDRKNKRRLIRYIEILQKDDNEVPKKNKPKYETEIFGLNPGKIELEKRIYKRLITRLEEGMVDEVETLHQDGVEWKKLEDFGLEYKFISQYLQDKLEYDEMVEKLNIATRQFAKRQMTWFRRWEKQGKKIDWDKYSKK